ncbi:hypothetical protein CM15mP94_3730 [bacterium]|nr:MAG: hypothetical protein CM15mP94_3730 [bacterium]
MKRELIRICSSPKLFVYSLVWLMVLVTVGTVAPWVKRYWAVCIPTKILFFILLLYGSITPSWRKSSACSYVN